MKYKKEKVIKEPKLNKKEKSENINLAHLKFKYWLMELKLGSSSIFFNNSVKMLGWICLGIIGIFTVLAIIYHTYGNLTVQVAKDACEKGIFLSTEKDNEFNNLKTRLFSHSIENCDNINIEDLPKDLHTGKHEGAHNGKNYLAYSFYIVNGGKEDVDYRYTVSINHRKKAVDHALWVMLFRDKELDIYAKERNDNTPERQYSYNEYTIAKDLGSKKADYITELTPGNIGNLTQLDMQNMGLQHYSGLYELATKPFVDDKIMCTGVDKKIKAGEERAYTLVAWLEGEDPECVDAIRGGSIGFEIKYELEDESNKKDKNNKNNKDNKDNKDKNAKS